MQKKKSIKLIYSMFFVDSWYAVIDLKRHYK